MSGAQEIACPNRDTGCQEVCNNQRDYEIHLQSCGFNTIPCPQECSNKVLKRNLINHLQSECPRRLVMCIYCKREMCDENLKDHQANCDYKRVKCEFCESFGIQKKDLSAHYEICEKKPRDCTLRVFGCTFSGPKAEFEEHVADITSHFPLLVKTIVELKSELSSKSHQILKLSQEGNAIKRRLLTLENTQQSQASEIKDLKAKLSDFRPEDIQSQTKTKKKGPSSVKSKSKTKVVPQLPERNFQSLPAPQSPASLVSSDHSDDSQDTIITDNMEPIVYQSIVMVSADNRWTIPKYESFRKSNMTVLWCNKMFSSHHHGYNFTLSLMIPPRNPTKKNIPVGMFISLVKSDHDDNLTWPFPYTVQMGFLNQRNNEEMEACRFSVNTVKEEYRCGFNKPMSVRNRKVGHPAAISLFDLENPTKGFLMNNQMVVTVHLLK